MPILTTNENALILLNICVNIFCVNALWPSDYIWRQRPWLSFIHATICRPFDVINQLERIRSAFHYIHQRCKLYECIPRFWSELFVSPFTGDSYDISLSNVTPHWPKINVSFNILQWNLSLTITSVIKFITCDLFSNENWRYQFTLANNFCLLELI